MNQDINLTNTAAEYLRNLILNGGGSPLTFLCLAVGDGSLRQGEEAVSRTALVHEVHRMPVETITQDGNGRVYITARLSTDILQTDFKQRELGIYVRKGAGELLLGYVNYGENYDYIPAPGGTAAVYKTITAAFDVMNLRATFRDLPSDDLVSFTAFNTRINEIIPELVNARFMEVQEEIGNAVADAANSAELAGGNAGKAEEAALLAEKYSGQTQEDREAVAEYTSTAETAAGNAAQSESVALEKAEGAAASAELAEQSAERANLSAEDVRRIAEEVVAMMKEIVPPRINYDGNHFYFNKFTEPAHPEPMCVYPYGYLQKLVGGRDNYELWLAAGNSGTLEDFLAAMRGPAGDEEALAEIKDQLESKTGVIWISEADYNNLAEKNPQTLYIIN